MSQIFSTLLFLLRSQPKPRRRVTLNGPRNKRVSHLPRFYHAYDTNCTLFEGFCAHCRSRIPDVLYNRESAPKLSLNAQIRLVYFGILSEKENTHNLTYSDHCIQSVYLKESILMKVTYIARFQCVDR